MAGSVREGRPLLFKTADELLAKAQGYFDNTSQDIWTITGLAVYLDTSRETLMNYEHRDEFFDAIKKLKDMIEMAYEVSLRKRGGSGDIFGLKNFGWKDKTETDITTGGDKLPASEISAETIAKFGDYLKENTKQ